jgi:hypothetical protein
VTRRIQAAEELADFDHAILGPIASIKPTELAA